MTAGTSGSSGERSSASTFSTLIFFSAIHSGREILMLDHAQPQRPSSSPRSTASTISAPPG